MARTRSAYPCLKPRGQQLTKNGKKTNYKHLSQTLTAEGEVSSLKCSLFILCIIFNPWSPFTILELKNPPHDASEHKNRRSADCVKAHREVRAYESRSIKNFYSLQPMSFNFLFLFFSVRRKLKTV